jgi:hypothetical protein
LLVLASAIGTVILGYQCLTWLHSGLWHPMSLDDLLLGRLRSIGSNWIGLQRIYDWILALPLVIFFYAVGIFVFWFGGVWSAALYKKAAHAQAKTVTPAQTHA